MGIFDSIKKSREEKKEKVEPVIKGPTLEEVMQDNEKSHLFGEFLISIGEEDLATRVAGKMLNEVDLALLNKQRKVFLEKMAKAEEIEKWLTKENIMSLAHNHPDFAAATGVLGVEKIAEMVKSQLKNIAITDEDRFKKLLGTIQITEDFKNGSYKKNEEEIEKLLKDKGINPKEYQDALAIEDPDKKEKALKELANRTNVFYKRAIYSIFKGGRFIKEVKEDTTLEEIKGSETLLNNSVAELNDHQKNIGAALFASLNSNDDMRRAFSGSLIGENAPEKSGRGFSEAKKRSFSEKKALESWEEAKRKQTKPTYDSFDVGRKEKFRDDFMKEQIKTYKEGSSGLWDIVFSAFFAKNINDMKGKFN